MAWFSSLEPQFLWLVIAGFFFAAEILTGTGWLLCLSLAALTTSGVALVSSGGLLWHLLLFSAIAVFLASARGIKKMVYRAAAPATPLNDRMAMMKGLTLVLDIGLISGTGQIRIGDSAWFVIADSDYPTGTKVRITGIEGIFLRVTLAE